MKRKLKYLVVALFALTATAFGVGCSFIKKDKCDHEYGATAKEVTREATCTRRGEEVWECLLCGEEKTVTTDTVEHNFNGGTVKKESICRTEGEMLYKCNDCDGTKIEVIPKSEHTIVDVAQQDPTCTVDGFAAYSYCSVCTEYVTPKVILPAGGHIAMKVKGKAATCSETGLTDGTVCGVCGDALIAQEVIPAKGHTIVTVPGYAPTCKPGMSNGSECSVCEEVFVVQTVLPAVDEHVYGDDCVCDECGYDRGHSYDDEGTCEFCGGKTAGFEYLSFRLNEDGASYEVLPPDYDEVQELTDIVIPAKYKGLPVSYISIGMFMDRVNIRSIVVPGSISNIGEAQFQNMPDLERVVLLEGVTTIPGGVFFNNPKLTSIVLPSTITDFMENWIQDELVSQITVTVPAGMKEYFEELIPEDVLIVEAESAAPAVAAEPEEVYEPLVSLVEVEEPLRARKSADVEARRRLKSLSQYRLH